MLRYFCMLSLCCVYSCVGGRYMVLPPISGSSYADYTVTVVVEGHNLATAGALLRSLPLKYFSVQSSVCCGAHGQCYTLHTEYSTVTAASIGGLTARLSRESGIREWHVESRDGS